MVEAGEIYLKDPSGKSVTFNYVAAGAGLAVGLKLPKIGKVEVNLKGASVGSAIAPAAFPNSGEIYILDALAGNELTADDIRGLCIFCEVGGAAVVGVSATAMIFGARVPTWLSVMVAVDARLTALELAQILASAKGILVMRGLNLTPSVGGGFGAYLGGLV
jgi:hypothetical protein